METSFDKAHREAAGKVSKRSGARSLETSDCGWCCRFVCNAFDMDTRTKDLLSFVVMWYLTFFGSSSLHAVCIGQVPIWFCLSVE